MVRRVCCIYNVVHKTCDRKMSLEKKNKSETHVLAYEERRVRKRSPPVYFRCGEMEDLLQETMGPPRALLP